MEVSKETSKIMTNSTNNISADIISINGIKLEEVTSFRYLGTTVCRNPHQDHFNQWQRWLRLGLSV